MEMRKAALPPICRAALKALALVATFFIVGAAPALAAPAKVLVFTGTAGTPNASSGDIATAIQSLGTTGQYTADVSSNASDINATKLADYRAVVFVNSSGNVLDATQETALTDYVNNGGGFVGIGETALLESGGATFFNTLLGLGATRTTGTATSSLQDIEFLDRVHPSTRALPQTARTPTPGTSGARTPPAPSRPSPASASAVSPARTASRPPTTRPRRAKAPRRTPSSPRVTAPPRGAATSSRAARSTPRWARRARRSPTPTSAST